MTGFSVGGRVVDSEGHGLEGVVIKIDDTERATTDSDGYYKLDQASYLNPIYHRFVLCFMLLGQH